LIIETMIKHLPPSASTLHLLDLNGATVELLRENRPDFAVTVGDSGEENAFDAVVVYGETPDDEALRGALRALRPGGRLIGIDPAGEPNSAQVRRLEAAGYTRILVEELAETGVLLRGEKPHVTDDTLARIQSVAARDQADSPLKGRYLHLLIRQIPNKPVWALKDGESVAWWAVALSDDEGEQLVAFSSLPNAVAFMQPAVISGGIKDVNKVAKFSQTAAQNWQRQNLRLLLNPPIEILNGRKVTFVPIDPDSAETSDE